MATQMSQRTSGVMIYFLLAMIFCQPVLAKLPLNFQRVLEVENPKGFKAAEGLKMLYYFVSLQDSNFGFFYEYDKAANFLSEYHFTVGIIDCQVVEDPDCQEPDIGTKIFMYNNDELWASLNLVNMFDVDSIGSNALQIALLDVVDIINTKVERLEKMAPLQGQKDIVYGYFSAIGTKVHRVFMEVAYAYNKKVQFMFTNSPRAVSDLEMSTTDNNSMIWIFSCKDMTSDSERAKGNCPSTLYRGDITLDSFLWALRLIDGPKHYYLPEDGSNVPCTSVHCIYLYYDENKKSKMIELADQIVDTYKGALATVLVDLESKEIQNLFHPKEDLPAISLTYAEQDDHQRYPMEDLCKEKIFAFIDEKLADKPNVTNDEPTFEDMNNMDHASFSIDDEIAASMYQSRLLNIDISLTGLTDKTFAEAVASPNLTLVLFFRDSDPAAKTILHHLSEWRDNNAQFPDLSLAYVNCYDWTDVCSKQMVLHTPTLRLVGNQRGQDLRMDPERTYKGALNPKDIISFLFTYGLDGAMKIDAQDADQFLSGELRGVSNLTSHSLFGLFKEKSHELEEFELASKLQRGKTLFAMMTGTGAETFAKTHSLTLPTVLALRWDDPLVPMSPISGPINKGSILEFSQSSKMPLFPELTPELLPFIYQSKRPLFILFCKAPDHSYNTLKNLVESREFKNVVFTWLNLTTYTDFGVQLVETYFKVPSLPAISMVYFSDKVAYNFEGKQVTEEAVSAWIKKLTIHRSTMEPSYHMKNEEWKPQRESFDFLSDHPFDHWENVKMKKKTHMPSSHPTESPKPAGRDEL